MNLLADAAVGGDGVEREALTAHPLRGLHQQADLSDDGVAAVIGDGQRIVPGLGGQGEGRACVAGAVHLLGVEPQQQVFRAAEGEGQGRAGVDGGRKAGLVAGVVDFAGSEVRLVKYSPRLVGKCLVDDDLERPVSHQRLEFAVSVGTGCEALGAVGDAEAPARRQIGRGNLHAGQSGPQPGKAQGAAADGVQIQRAHTGAGQNAVLQRLDQMRRNALQPHQRPQDGAHVAQGAVGIPAGLAQKTEGLQKVLPAVEHGGDHNGGVGDDMAHAGVFAVIVPLQHRGKACLPGKPLFPQGRHVPHAAGVAALGWDI